MFALGAACTTSSHVPGVLTIMFTPFAPHKAVLRRRTVSSRRSQRPLLQDAVQTVAGDVAALQALGHKALQKRSFRCKRAAGSHPGGRRFESLRLSAPPCPHQSGRAGFGIDDSPRARRADPRAGLGDLIVANLYLPWPQPRTTLTLPSLATPSSPAATTSSSTGGFSRPAPSGSRAQERSSSSCTAVSSRLVVTSCRNSASPLVRFSRRSLSAQREARPASCPRGGRGRPRGNRERPDRGEHGE
jgi:hypothetical protein